MGTTCISRGAYFRCMVPRIFVLTLMLVPAAPAAEVEFVTTDLPWAAVHHGYAPPPLDTRVSGKCPSGGIGYSVVSGALPPGVALSSLGYFSGIAARTETSRFMGRGRSGCPGAGRRFSLVVAEPRVSGIAPATVKLTSRAPTGVLQISSTWPGLRYQVRVTADWLSASPEH